MSYQIILVYLMIAILPSAWAHDLSNREVRLFELINEARMQAGLYPLVLNNKLSRMARSAAKRMQSEYGSRHLDNNQFYYYNTAGSLAENVSWLAQSRSNPENVVRGWLKSPGHRRHLLSTTSRQLGVGNAGGYWTAEFK